jgi:hypothetical protein
VTHKHAPTIRCAWGALQYSQYWLFGRAKLSHGFLLIARLTNYNIDIRFGRVHAMDLPVKVESHFHKHKLHEHIQSQFFSSTRTWKRGVHGIPAAPNVLLFIGKGYQVGECSQFIITSRSMFVELQFPSMLFILIYTLYICFDRWNMHQSTVMASKIPMARATTIMVSRELPLSQRQTMNITNILHPRLLLLRATHSFGDGTWTPLLKFMFSSS